MENATERTIVYIKSIESWALNWLQLQVDSTDKLYLLHGRCEPQKDKPPTAIALYLRHSLFRYVDHAHQPVPGEAHLCRFCAKSVETPEHALLECVGSPMLVELRKSFLEKLLSTAPNLRERVIDQDLISFLKSMIYQHTIILTAKFTHDVLEIFYAVPLHC
jgi:hypothetical protein